MHLGPEQRPRQTPLTIDLAGHLFNAGKGRQESQVQIFQVEAAIDGPAFGIRVHRQFQVKAAQFGAPERHGQFGGFRLQPGFQGQGFMLQGFPVIQDQEFEGPAASIKTDQAIRALFGECQVNVCVQGRLPAEGFREQRRQRLHGELANLIGDPGIRQQLLVFSTHRAGLPAPAVGAKQHFAVSRVIQACRRFHPPGLLGAGHIDFAPGQGALPAVPGFTQGAGERQRHRGFRVLHSQRQLVVRPGTIKVCSHRSQFLPSYTQRFCVEAGIQHTATGKAGIQLHVFNAQQVLPFEFTGIKRHLARGILRRTRQVHPGREATGQAGQQTVRLRQVHSQARAQALTVAPLAFYPVLRYRHQQILHAPVGAVAAKFTPGGGRLLLPATFQVPVGGHYRQAVRHQPALGIDLTVETGFQHRHPVARVELIQQQPGLPGQLIREGQFGIAGQGTCPGGHIQLCDANRFQVPGQGCGKLRIALRTAHRRL